MAEMVELAGLNMHQLHQVMGDEQFRGPEGHVGKPSRPKQWGIRLSDQEWSLGPGGLMSLGEMLLSAGDLAFREEEPPPPPDEPVPDDHVAHPPPTLTLKWIGWS
eukprot:570015-Karenia_brevis.AAC.1